MPCCGWLVVLAQVSSAADLIQILGYPLEIHEVVTEDGYVLRMERIPYVGGRDVAFFMHGVLDTSLTWVSAGAWDCYVCLV